MTLHLYIIGCYLNFKFYERLYLVPVSVAIIRLNGTQDFTAFLADADK